MSATSSADRIFELELDLLIGSRDVFSDAELERGWKVYGAELISSLVGRSVPGTRPWGYWKFDLKEQEPDEPALRLAELGLLRDDEVAAIAARAAAGRPRIGTAAEHHDGQGHSADREAVELHEAVTAVLQARR